MTWAAFGVCSLADAIADQEPLTITSPDDAEELLGTGPLRDLLVCGLTGVGTSASLCCRWCAVPAAQC